MTASDLTAALAAMQDRTERRLPPPVSNFAGIVGTEPYPVTQKAKQVISRLISHGVMRFLALFQGSRSRSEIVATFLAVLELCRLRSVSDGRGRERANRRSPILRHAGCRRCTTDIS